MSYSHGTRGVDGREPMMSSDEKPPAYFLKEAVSKFVHCGGRGLPDVNRIQLNDGLREGNGEGPCQHVKKLSSDIRNVLNVAVSQEDLPAHQRASLLRVAFDGMRLDLTKPEDVSLKFQDYTIEDQVLLSNSFWAAFECDVEANESMVCATLSVQYDLAWHVLPCTFVPVLLNRHVDVLAWRASHGDRGTAPIDTVLAMLKKKKPPYFVLDETAGMLRTRYSAMVACKLYDETRVHGGDVLARLDSKLKRSLAPPSHGHGLVCEELTNGVTTLMECTSQGSEFLALQLLLRWHSLTQTTAKERADVTARFARLLSRGSNDPLVIIGAIEMCINFATTFKDRDQYESTFDTLSKLPESLFHAANVPSKAVYKAVFATRWAVAIGNCHDWGATGVPELVKECCSTALNFRNLRAHPFAQLRFGLSVHLYHLGLDLMAAVTNSGVTENRAEVDDLATWLTSHVSDVFRDLWDEPSDEDDTDDATDDVGVAKNKASD